MQGARDPAIHTVVLVSDFNVGNLRSYLQSDHEQPSVRVVMPDYGQVMQTLLDAGHPCWQDQAGVAVIWTRPEAVIESFGRVLQAESVPIELLLDEVDRFADLVIDIASRVRAVMLPTWAHPVGHRGLGPIDLRPGGVGYALARMNLRLADRLHEHPTIFVVDSDRWVAEQKNPALAFKYWYASKSPYCAEVFQQAARQLKALLRAITGQNRKLLILDLDDTLWGGIVGDLGWENVRLGGHDPVGEAFLDFQRGIKALQSRGIVLAVVSKNEESVALEAIDRHPEMLIRRDDLAGWRINWQDKAQNIIDLVNELNLGMDAAVFIDDNPAERGRVAEALPQLYVPDWPPDKLLYRHALNTLTCFDPAAISIEDVRRAGSYVAERGRRQSRSRVSIDDWLQSLELHVRIEPLGDSNRQRATQLLNKTNQMNLSTRRLTETELEHWVQQEGRSCWVLWVADRFGDSGLTGLISVDCRDGICTFVDFVLSCRVFGRHIENVMTGIAVRHAQAASLESVHALYLPTAKNRPTLDFFAQRSGFGVRDAHAFLWSTADAYPFPAFITVQMERPGTIRTARP